MRCASSKLLRLSDYSEPGWQQGSQRSGLAKDKTIDEEYLVGLAADDWFRIRMKDDQLNEQLERAEAHLQERREGLDAIYRQARQN